MNNQNDYIEAAQQIIVSLGLPRAQQNERSALCLLALLNLTPGKAWADAENPLVGITPIMDWAREHYGKEYAPNTRETFRRQTMHQFCDAGEANDVRLLYATWAAQGRGNSINVVNGFIAISNGVSYHADIAESALSGLKRKISRAQPSCTQHNALVGDLKTPPEGTQ